MPRASRRSYWGIITGYVLLTSFAALVYRPWFDQGFDIEDFSEFQPLLESQSTILGRFNALREYYAAHGRWNVVPYLATAVKWSFLGPAATTWQWLRFIQMLVIACAASRLIVALGMREGTAIVVAGLLLFSSAGAAAFERLTMAEPLALTFLLAILFIGLRYQRVKHWRAWGVVIGVMVALLLATKEILVICVPFAMAFVLSFRAGTFGRPEWSRRNLYVFSVVLAAVIVAGLPVVAVVKGSPASSYESAYGQGGIGFPRYLALVCYMVLPIQSASPPSIWPPLYPANLIFGALFLSGLGVWVFFHETSWQPFTCAAALLCLLLTGALAYLPWPRYEAFYSLPFVFASGQLLPRTQYLGVQSMARLELAVLWRETRAAQLALTWPPYRTIRGLHRWMPRKLSPHR